MGEEVFGGAVGGADGAVVGGDGKEGYEEGTGGLAFVGEFGEGASCWAVVQGCLFEHGGTFLLVGEFAAVGAGCGGCADGAAGCAVGLIDVDAAGLGAGGCFAGDGGGAAGVCVGWWGWGCCFAGEGALGFGGGLGGCGGVQDAGWGVLDELAFVFGEGDGDGFLHEFGADEEGVLEVGPGGGEVGLG